MIVWIIFLIWQEMQHWLIVRQQYLISKHHSKQPQASTVLITGIPKDYMDERRLEQLFSSLPGGVKRIWLARYVLKIEGADDRNLREMPGYYERRIKACQMLEKAQVTLIKLAQKGKQEREKKGDDKMEIDNDIPLVDQLVPRSKRPTFTQKPKWAPFGLGWLGIGQKIDKIDWARKEIALCTQALESGREQLQSDVNSVGAEKDYYPPLSSAFVHFNHQIAAHMAFQCLPHNRPYRMAERYIEQAPQNVVWRNLSLNPYESKIRMAASYAITAGMILVWAIPVSFISALSSITGLISAYPWLNWLDFLERPGFGYTLLKGVVSGVLPPVLLALIMMVLPVILRRKSPPHSIADIRTVHVARDAIENTGRTGRHEPILCFLGHRKLNARTELIAAHILCRDLDKRSDLRPQGSWREPSLDRYCPCPTNAPSLDILHHPHPHPIHRDRLDAHPANLACPLLYPNYSRRRYTSIHVYISIPFVQRSMGNHLSRYHRLRSHCHRLHGHFAHH
jgi:hypothetical protein